MATPGGPMGDGFRLVTAWSTILMTVLTVLASVLLVGTYGFDFAAVSNPGVILGSGQAGAERLRWALLVDMASYLPLTPIVIYLHQRLRWRSPGLVDLVTACGMAYVLIGAIGGAILAAGTPPLMAAYATASQAGREAIRSAFIGLTDSVEIGLWGTLELIPFGIWALGIGWCLRTDWPRLGFLLGLAGVGALAASVRTAIAARPLVDIQSPADVVALSLAGLFFPATLWLAANLVRGHEPTAQP